MTLLFFFYESKNMTELHAIDTIPCRLVTRSSHPHIFSRIFENGKATHSLVTKLQKVSLWCTVGVMINIISIFRDYCINHQNILHTIFLEKLYFCKKIILIIIYFGMHYEFLFIHIFHFFLRSVRGHLSIDSEMKSLFSCFHKCGRSHPYYTIF